MQRLTMVFVVGLILQAMSATACANAVYTSRHHDYRVEALFGELHHPWGLAFLPSGRMLVTEQAGYLNLLDPANGRRKLVEGTPPVAAVGQGGLLDVALHPNFESNRLVHLSYAVGGEGGYATQVGRGQLRRGRLKNSEVLFAIPFAPGNMQFGLRLAFDHNGYLFVTAGDRREAHRAQDLGSYHGSVIRLTDDGRGAPGPPRSLFKGILKTEFVIICLRRWSTDT